MPKLGVQKKDGTVVYFDWNRPTDPSYEEAIAEAERQAAPPQPAPKPSVSQDVAESPSLMSPRGWMDEIGDVAQGFVGEARRGIYGGGDWIRRQLGMERVIEKPEVQRVMEVPENTSGMIGSALEQAVEFGAAPATLEARAAKTAFPWLAKKATQAGMGAGQAFLHSGGDPTQTAIGATAGVAIPAIVNPLLRGAGTLMGRETAEQAAARIAREVEAARGGMNVPGPSMETGTAGPIRPPTGMTGTWADPRVPPNVRGSVGVPEPPVANIGRQIPPTNPSVVSTSEVPPPVQRPSPTGARQPAGAFGGPRPQIAQYAEPMPPPSVPFDPRSAFGAPVDIPNVPAPEPLGLPSRSVTTPRFEGPEVGAPGAVIDVDVPAPTGVAGVPPPNAPSPTGIVKDASTGRFRRMTPEEAVNVPSQNVPFNQLPEAEKNAFREFLKVNKPEIAPQVLDDPAYIASDTDYLAFLKQQDLARNVPAQAAYPPSGAGQTEFVGTSSPGRAAADIPPVPAPEEMGLVPQRPELPFTEPPSRTTRVGNQSQLDELENINRQQRNSALSEGRNINDVQTPLDPVQQQIAASHSRVQEHQNAFARWFSKQEEMLPEGQFFEVPPDIEAKYQAEQAALKEAHQSLVQRLTGGLEPDRLPDIDVPAPNEADAVPSGARAEISDLMDRLAASLKRTPGRNKEAGQATSKLAVPLGGGLFGGAAGATQGETTEERVRNALIGAALGAGGTHTAAGALAGGKAGAKTALREAAEQFNSARMIPMLTGLAPAKSALGNIGAFGTSAIEDLTSGNPARAGRLMKELFNVPENARQFKTGWTAGQNPYQTSGIGALNIPGKFMGASDYAAQKGLERAGRSSQEAAETLLTAPLGVHGTTAEIMSSPIGKYFMPFQRTPINTAIQFGKKAMERPVLSAGAAGAGYLTGSETDDPRKVGLASALAGPYAGAFLAGAAAGAGKGSLFGSISPVPEWGISKSLLEPTTAFTKPAFVSAFKELFQGDKEYPESWSGIPSRKTKQEQATRNREKRRRDFLNR